MKIGDLVVIKMMKNSDYGIVLEIDYKEEWTKVYWITIGDSWSFFSQDLEVISETG